MKNRVKIALEIVGILLSVWLLTAGCVAAQTSTERPNFVLIVVDDLGWADLACYGNRFHETPNIDRLAASGVRFTSAYAAAAVCSPSRAAILTGRYPARTDVTDAIRDQSQRSPAVSPASNKDRKEDVKRQLITPPNGPGLDQKEVTLAEALKSAGYVSGHIGKWHLGADDWYPEKQGFDTNVGGCNYSHPPRYFFPYQTELQPAIPGLDQGQADEYLTDREAEEALKFIEANRNRPFLLCLAHYAVHAPLQAKASLTAKYRNKRNDAENEDAVYAAMIESVDQAVGRILDKLDELDLARKTVVMLTSDNGGSAAATSNAPWRAGKGSPYEGGIHVPLIIRLPNSELQGEFSKVPVSGIDIFPTIMELAEVPSAEQGTIDGESLVGLLHSETSLERKEIYWHYPHYFGEHVAPYGIVRAGDYKLIRHYEDGSTELFNLQEDLGETTNLSQDLPDKAKQLDMMLSKWLIGVGAKMPRPVETRAEYPEMP